MLFETRRLGRDDDKRPGQLLPRRSSSRRDALGCVVGRGEGRSLMASLKKKQSHVGRETPSAFYTWMVLWFVALSFCLVRVSIFGIVRARADMLQAH